MKDVMLHLSQARQRNRTCIQLIRVFLGAERDFFFLNKALKIQIGYLIFLCFSFLICKIEIIQSHSK